MYKVHYQKQAARKLTRMPRNLAQQISYKVELIAKSPYSHHTNVTKLKGRKNSFRLRLGNWRVVYIVDYETKVLLVAKIHQRGQVYK